MINILPVKWLSGIIRGLRNKKLMSKISNSEVFKYNGTEVIILTNSEVAKLLGDTDWSKSPLIILKDKSKLTKVGRKFHEQKKGLEMPEVMDLENRNLVQVIAYNPEDHEEFLFEVEKEDVDDLIEELAMEGLLISGIFNESDQRTFSIKQIKRLWQY